MNKLIVTLIVAGALAVPTMASAQGSGHGFGQRSGQHSGKWFSRMDANGDGVVSKDEIARFAEKRFASADHTGTACRQPDGSWRTANG